MELAGDLYTVTGRADSETSLSADIRLNPDCDIYRGHFPGNPITPGVIMIRIAGELLSAHLGVRLRLAAVGNIKYLSIISPVDTPCVTYRIDKIAMSDDNVCSAQVSVTGGSGMFAKMSLKYHAGK